MKTVLLLASLLATPAIASHLDTVCENSLSFSGDIYFAGSDFLARPRGSGATIEKLDGTLVREFDEPVKAIAVHGDSLWVLTSFDLHEMSFAGVLKASYNFEPSGNPDWAGQALATSEAGFAISRGLAGVMGFALATRQFTWQNLMDTEADGNPAGLAIHDGKVYVAVATNREGGFTGVATLDLGTGKTINRMPYNRSSSGVLAPDALATWHDGKLYLNNGGWIHVLTEAQLNSARAAKPRWMAHVVPANGPVSRHYMMLTSGFFFSNDSLVGCGAYTDAVDEVFVRRARLFEVKLN